MDFFPPFKLAGQRPFKFFFRLQTNSDRALSSSLAPFKVKMRSARPLLSRLASALSRDRDSERAARAFPSSMPSLFASPSSTPSSSSFSTSSLSSSPPSFAEIRQYTLHPSKTAEFIAATAKTIQLRKQLPFLAMLQCEVGCLNTVTHFYLYGDLACRDRLRASLASSKGWTDGYLPVSRACVASQTSLLLQVEAEIALKAKKMAIEEEFEKPGVFDFTIAPPSLAALANDSSRVSARALASERHGGVLALRGSVAVGTGRGLGSHVAVGSHVEVWRFADAAAAVSGRSAADAPAAGVSRQLLKPLSYSPWQ